MCRGPAAAGGGRARRELPVRSAALGARRERAGRAAAGGQGGLNTAGSRCRESGGKACPLQQVSLYLVLGWLLYKQMKGFLLQQTRLEKGAVRKMFKYLQR